MIAIRSATRAAAVLGATAALGLSTMGAASATTATPETGGNRVAVTFALEAGQVRDTCGAALLEPNVAMDVVGAISDGNLAEVFTSLQGTRGVYVLTSPASGLPAAVLTNTTPALTLAVDDVPNGVYALVSACVSDSEVRNPSPVVIGDPLAAITGSLGGADSLGGDQDGGIALDTLSSTLDGAVV